MTKVKDSYGREIDFDAAMNVADQDIKDEVASKGDFESDQEFIEQYAELHEERFGEPFAPYAGLEW